MKNRLIFLSGIFTLTFSSTDLLAQGLSVSGDAALFVNSQGLVFSTGSLKLSGTSQVHGVEAVRLTASDFIEMQSPDARLVTGLISNSLNIPVGIGSRASLNLKPGSNPASFSIGMDNSEEENSLPFKWKISNVSSNQELKTGIDFSWEKAVEPADFELKALLIEEVGEWELPLNQQVGENMISLVDFSEFEKEGSFFTVKNFTSDSDEDEVPDIIEIRNTTDLKDPGAYLDSDGDGVPDYVEIVDGTDPFDSNDYKDSTTDGVPDYVGLRSPLAFLNLENVNIPWGFQNYTPLFQDSVLTILGSGRLLRLPLDWNYQQLNIYARGTYPVTSELPELPRGVFNAYKKTAIVDGIVLPKLAPQNIFLSNNTFEAPKSNQEVAIGSFMVEDAVDNIHLIGFESGVMDNNFFKIENDVLYWNSEDPAAGRTNFAIAVKVTDRDGNILEKNFTIERQRISVAGIEVFNTFSPNNDGNNDTWGVPELRYYRNVRIQVFDRGTDRLFYTENPNEMWDGTFNGKELPVGTYYWTIEVGETREVRKGMLNLFRK
ncbi:gliding motility-associated C-terminal domain-containing protein [Belliella aquatica]|uniref:Gliding motility-associated C-terminal domain-containing protein n=1 Tax=Belliella aquatica TaxID=1323734 RepID=A0ABQ1NAK7_9BACT|nr:gliding motility-associated C-terminal domain-containing protein [Belliella aquatica]MCH7407362.1 gliding motility-associated C-terminal domain-containing protein [Belliella aquatica]GGC52777.1 hypothetical protein GCM10010993_34070 [Belliella aquatica]